MSNNPKIIYEEEDIVELIAEDIERRFGIVLPHDQIDMVSMTETWAAEITVEQLKKV